VDWGGVGGVVSEMSVGGKTGGGREWRCGGGRWEGEGERCREEGKVGIGDREVGDGATRKMGERRWGMGGGVWNQVRRLVGGRYID